MTGAFDAMGGCTNPRDQGACSHSVQSPKVVLTLVNRLLLLFKRIVASFQLGASGVLHIIYRSCGSENAKGRPTYYDKTLCLMSLIRAFENLDKNAAELIFLNDGPIPPDRLALMESTGEVIAHANLGMRGSMRAALAIPIQRAWDPNDLVWFAEDDYLYLPHALSDLAAAAEAYPDAAYFALYALIGLRPPYGGTATDRIPKRFPGDGLDRKLTTVNDRIWCQALSTTSTFGGRVKTIEEDRTLMHLAMMSGGAWDHTTCLMYQGYRPYPISSIFHLLRASNGLTSALRCAAVSVGLIALNGYQVARAWTGPGNRLLVAPETALITHLESVFLAEGTDWQSVAKDTRDWTTKRQSNRAGSGWSSFQTQPA
jgi:hypothetical protein